jgi:transposase
MSHAYSEDLRIRLVQRVENGSSARSAAKLFKVSASTAVKWVQRWRREKIVAPSPVRGHRRRLLDRHGDWLLELVATKPDLTLEEIRAHLRKRGVVVCLWTVWNFYKHSQMSFKKPRIRQRAGSRRRHRRPRAVESQSSAA